MTKYLLFFTAISFFAFNLCSQQALPVDLDTSGLKRSISLQGGITLQSNHLVSPTFSKIYRGGFITSEEIQNSVDRLNDSRINRTGAVAHLDLVYADYTQNLFKKNRFGYVITAGYQTYVGATYSAEFFKLFSQGNMAAAELIDLTDLRGYQMTHQKLGFGILDKQHGSSFSLNVVGSSGFNSLDLQNGVIRQTENRDTTDILVVGEFLGANSGPYFKGLGLALDVDFRMPVVFKEKTYYVQVLAQNIGAVRLQDVQRYSLDTLYQFAGFSIDQMINLNNTENFSLQDSLNINPEVRNSYQFLPGFLQVSKVVNPSLEQKLQAFYGVNVFTQIIYLPQVFAGAHWQISKNLALGVSGNLGGFGSARLGAYADIALGDFRIGLSSQDVLGSTGTLGTGQSLLFRLSWQQK